MLPEVGDESWTVFLTNFGDLAVALPVGLVGVLYMLRHRRPDLAAIFGLNVALALVATVMLKVISRAEAGTVAAPSFGLSQGAPSGHVVDAVSIYGGFALLVAMTGRGLIRVVAIVVALVLIACVGVTRVTLGAHTTGDVLAGLVTGGVFVLLIAVAARRKPAAGGWALLLLLMMVAAGVMQLSGLRLASTQFL